MKKTMNRMLAILLAVLMLVSTASVSFAASVGQVQKLSLASRSSTQIKLKWQGVSKATGYRVESYDAAKKTWSVEGYTTNKYFIDKGLNPGTKVTYRVSAYVKRSGDRSFGKASEKLSVLTNPERVAKVKINGSSATAVNLKWNAAKGATSYIIYQSASADKGFKQIATTKKNSYKVTFKASPGTVYFKVKSVAKSGDLTRNADASPAVKAVILPGTVASLSAADATNSYVTLKWSACKGATGYIVYLRDVNSGDEYSQIATTTKTTYKVNFAAAPGTVYFRVQAFSKVGKVTTKSALSPTLKMNMKPQKVTALTLQKAGPTTLNLVWNAADGASKYQVYMRNEEDYTYNVIAEVTDSSYTVTGLKPSTDYRFAVKAVADYNGSVLITGYSPVLIASTVFGEVTGFDFMLDSDNKVHLTWNEVKGAEGYQIEKSLNNDGNWSVIGDVKNTVYEASSVEKGKTLTAGTKYCYRIRAYATENGEKLFTGYSETMEVHPITGAPKITRSGTGAKHSIVLEWTEVAGADAYEIFFLDEKSGAWRSLVETEGMTYTNEKGVKTVYYSENNIETTGDYQYRVRAVVKNNKKENYSSFSNTWKHHYVYTPEPEVYYVDAVQKVGIVGYLYDPKEDVFFTADDPWQRNFGFNQVYDIFSQVVMIQYDTERIQFTCHNGEEWMIQPWKGQYGWILYGGEVGIYKKYTEREADHYDCAKDEDRLMMQMDLYKYNSETGKWEHIFQRPYGTYWWITGFKLGYVRFTTPIDAQKFSTFPDLYLDIRITMMDFDMRNAVLNEMKAMNIDYKVDGLDVYFKYQ